MHFYLLGQVKQDFCLGKRCLSDPHFADLGACRYNHVYQLNSPGYKSFMKNNFDQVCLKINVQVI